MADTLTRLSPLQGFASRFANLPSSVSVGPRAIMCSAKPSMYDQCASTSWSRSASEAARTIDFSEDRKSPAVMVATLVRESGDQAPMRCGWALA